MPVLAEIEAKITADTSSFDAGMAKASSSLDTIGSKAQTQSQSMQTVGIGLAGIGAAAGVGFGAAVGAAADFEFQMDAVNAAMGGLDTGQMEAVEEQALALGASSKFSAGEITGVQEALGKAGISVETVLDGATDAVTNMAAATGEDLTRSGEAAAAAINLFGLEGEEVTGVADTFTAALNNSSATLSDMRTGINNLGPVMSNLNMYAGDGEEAFTDTAAAVAYFNAQGLKAADAGVSLARGMTNLANPTSDASAKMKELGISAFDASGNFLPLPDIMDNLSVGMAGMSDEAREAALATIFGAEAADVMNIAIKNGGEGLRQYEADMVASGQAAEQAAIRQDNLSGAMEALGGSIETAVVAIGQGFVPILTTAAKGISTLVNAFLELPKPIQTAVGAVTGLVAILGVGLGGAILIVPKIMAFAQAWGVVTAALKETALASKLLAVGFGPIGIALAAIGLAVVAYQTNFLGFRDAVHAVADALGPILGAAAQKAGEALRFVGDVLALLGGGIADKFGGAVQFISDRLADLQRTLSDPIAVSGFFAAIDDALGPIDEAISFVIEKLGAFKDAIGSIDIGSGLQAVGDWFQDHIGDRIQDVIEKLGEWKDTITSIELPPQLTAITDWFGEKFGRSVDVGVKKLSDFELTLQEFSSRAQNSFQETSDSLFEVFNQFGRDSGLAELMGEVDVQTDAATASVRGLNDAWVSGTDFASQFARSVDSVTTAQGTAAAATEELSELQKEWLKTFREVLDPAQAQGFVASITAAIPPMQSVLQVLTKIGDMGFPIQDQQFANFVASLETANAGLTTTLNTMGQIQALGSSLQGAADIATKLVGDPGVYATVDDLLNKNLISIDLYNGAQRAQISTVEANARAQEALNVMMVQQIPLLGHQAQLYADQLVALSKMPAAEQQLALAMMDTATQAKIAGAASAVYSAALGEIPSDIATDLVANAARADPIIADLLDKYGIIELGAEGEITVVFPDLAQRNLEKFQAAFEGQQVRMIDGLIHVTTASGTELVYDQFNNLVEQNGTTITASVDLQFKGFEAGAASGQGFGATFDNIGTDVANLVSDSVAKADFSASGDAVQANLGTALTAVDVSSETAELATTVTGDLSTGITDDAAAVELAATAVVTDAVTAAGTEAATANEAGAKLVQSIGDQITTDSGSVATKLSLSVTDAVTAATTSAATAITVGQQMATSTVEGITQYDLNISTALSGSVDSAIAAATLSAGAATGVGQEMINILVGGIENVEANVSTALSGAVGTATTDATNKATEAKTVGSTLITNIGVGVTGAQGELTSVLQNAVLGAIQGISALSGAATEAGTAIGTALGTAVGAGAAAAMPAVRGQIESALSGISVNVPVNVNVTANVTGQAAVTAAAENIGGEFGVAVDQGMATGLSNGEQYVVDAAYDMINNGVIAPIADATLSESPSKVAMQYGEWWGEGFAIGIINGIPQVQDAAGNMIAPLSQLELDLALLAHQQGEAYLYAFVETLRNGSDWVMDEAGVIADQFGSTLAADFTAVLSDTKDVYTGFGEQLGAMVTEGMASGGWTEEATMIAKDAGVATGAEYAAGVTETTPAIADAMTTLTDTATAPLAQMPIDTCAVATESVNTMASCIADGGTAVADAAAQVGAQATDTLRATLPDMAEIGAMMTDETSKGARGRSRDLSDAIKANLDEGVNLGRVVSRTASQIGNDLVTASVAGVRQTVQQLHASITQSVQQSIATGTNTSRGAVQTGTTLMTSAADGVRSNAGKITTGTSNAVTNAIGAGQNTAGGADVVGTELGSGIATGLIDQIPAIEEAARKAVRAAIDAAKDEADISSPSKVARHEIGRMWGEGLALGIADMADDVATASESLMGSMDSPGRASLSPAFLAAGGIPGHSDMHPGRGGDGGSGSVHIGTVNLPGVQNAQQFVDEIRQIAREQGVSAARRVR